MFRVTTPTHTFIMPVDTSDCAEILLTYKQGDLSMSKHYENGIVPDGMTLDENQVIQTLTQEETKRFKVGFANVQIRVLLNNGKSYASQIFKVGINEVLNGAILS